MNSASPARKTALRSLSLLMVAFAMMVSPLYSQEDGISDSAKQQIAAFYALKAQFNSAEQKMSSDLAFLSMGSRGVDISAVRGILSTQVDANGEVVIAAKSSAPQATLNTAVSLDGDSSHVVPVAGGVVALFPVSQLAALASDPSVKSLGLPDGRHTNTGSITSQGYISHRANQTVSLYRGQGVKVGVLSDSASAAKVAALIATGDLGADTVVLPGQDGSGEDEGAAMMEIIHDLAPDAQLYFATADPTPQQMAANIASMAALGCTIIVDDVSYYNEGAFQDGPIAQAVNAFTAGGGLYFSAAANSGNKDGGTSGTWEGDFINGGSVTTGPIFTSEGGAVTVHNFGGQNFDRVTNGGNIFSLKWSDPLGGSSNDYDLFVLNSGGTAIKAASGAAQTGTQDPYEALQYTPAVNDRIVVVLYSGVARALRLDTNRATIQLNTAGSTYGHNAAASTVTVAATYWNSAKTGTKPFTGFANPIEPFSSDGPRKLFYNPDGTAITPGNVLFATNGGITLQKPDVTAADGVSTRSGGLFTPFFGTSAAAPHAAAIAAIVKSANPTLTNTQLRTILTSTALDNMAPGVDRDGGYGIVMAQQAVQAALPH